MLFQPKNYENFAQFVELGGQFPIVNARSNEQSMDDYGEYKDVFAWIGEVPVFANYSHHPVWDADDSLIEGEYNLFCTPDLKGYENQFIEEVTPTPEPEPAPAPAPSIYTTQLLGLAMALFMQEIDHTEITTMSVLHDGTLRLTTKNNKVYDANQPCIGAIFCGEIRHVADAIALIARLGHEIKP